MDARDRRIVALAVPALGSLAIEPLYVLVDTAIVGRLGTEPLGGLALASTVLTTAFFVCNFLAYGVTPRVAFRFGRGDRSGAAHVAVQGLWLAAMLGMAIGAVLVAGGRALPRLLGGSGDVLGAATTYLRISALATPFVLVSLVGTGYLRGVQDTRTPLVIAAIANAANLVIELWLVFGLGWGVAGSAWSTVLAQTGAGIAFGVVVLRTRAPMRPERSELRALARAARHLSVRTGALLATLALSTSVAARRGATILAAHQIALQVETFLALAVDALAIAGQALVGAALGAGDRREARTVGRRLLRFGAWSGGALCLALAASSPLLSRAFTTQPDVVRQATAGLVMVGILQLPAALVFVLDGVLIGANDLRYLQLGTVLGLVAFVPAAVVVLRLELGIVAIWTGMLMWMCVRLAVNGTRFAGERWTSSGT